MRMFWAILALAVVMASGAGSVAAFSLTPGEYVGDWSFGTASGKLYLTITKVEGSVVTGEVLATGSPLGAEKFNDGVFEGNVLTIKTRSRLITLTAGDDGAMSGDAVNLQRNDVRSAVKNVRRK